MVMSCPFKYVNAGQSFRGHLGAENHFGSLNIE